ncbi:hypothetical protein BJY04DRAFT_193210 [Aspergillus karnatakaensis]|uniref:uncharacterized protein n=1 Tax=Aspergillus karnatakaensis TaxID=1810916 RepID=UPI003CCD430B
MVVNNLRPGPGPYVPASYAWLPFKYYSLTEFALRELRRRTRNDYPNQPARPSVSATWILRRLTPDRLKELETIARAGGFDITDIRGYPLLQGRNIASFRPPTVAREVRPLNFLSFARVPIAPRPATEDLEERISSIYTTYSVQAWSNGTSDASSTFTQISSNSENPAVGITSDSIVADGPFAPSATARRAEASPIASGSSTGKRKRVVADDKSQRKVQRRGTFESTVSRPKDKVEKTMTSSK